MKIPKEVYRYIEYELYHYEEYKEKLEIERELILESSSGAADGQPRGSRISNIPLDKTIRLNESVTIMSLERIVKAVDKSMKSLSPLHRKVFEEFFNKGRKDIYMMCDDLGISRETFYRYKHKIICLVGLELGILNSVTQN